MTALRLSCSLVRFHRLPHSPFLSLIVSYRTVSIKVPGERQFSPDAKIRGREMRVGPGCWDLCVPKAVIKPPLPLFFSTPLSC